MRSQPISALARDGRVLAVELDPEACGLILENAARFGAGNLTLVQGEAPAALVLDGFNTIITLEVALSGSLLLEGMDGTIRDLAGLRGSYRIVDKTVRAVELLLARLEALEVKEALFYLDQQVSNSGRLRALLLDKAAERSVQIQVELHPSVDGVLSRLENVVTTDAIILDKCGSWYNLNRELIEEAVPEAWVLRLEPSYI